MPKPIILTLDDEPSVLNAIERDLVQHFHGEYRIVKAASGADALRAVKQFKKRNEAVALFLVDQRMAGMSGTEFLSATKAIYPQARRVLLTAYSDTEAAIASINEIDLDYFLMKPWDPPEQNIEVLTRTTVVEAHGGKQLEAITIRDNNSDETRRVETPAMFIFIGAVPHTELVAGLVERNNAGFLLTGVDLLRDGRQPEGWQLRRDPYLLETSVPGIFAAGDVRQGAVRRVASAVGQGANAINFVHQYLRTV